MNDQTRPAPVAGVILIGNELLSGRTRDGNLSHIAARLLERGITVREARVIADDPQVIKNTVNTLRETCDFVFTTGGIGPTHDDITAECVAAAFGVNLHLHPEAERLLRAYFDSRGVAANTARLRMAHVPEGAELVDNPVSVAPGFRIGNVFVMAGVPKIMHAMLENILPQLPDVGQWYSENVICDVKEGTLAAPLGVLQSQFPSVELGSYPGKSTDFSRVTLVARGREKDQVAAAASALREMIKSLGGAEFAA